MNRTTKGAIAAAAAAVLLLGGAGSLAYWSATQDAGTANITSGEITLAAPDCTTNSGTHDWELDNGDPFVPGTTDIVPGDSISKVCDLDLELVGEHIGATLDIDAADITGDATTLGDEISASASFLVDDVAYAPITGAGSHVVRATIEVTFAGPAATNGSMNGDVDLDAINVTATQTHTP